MKYLFYFLFLLAPGYYTDVVAQQVPPSNTHTLYVDIASRGNFYSLNYDRIFSRGHFFTTSWRAGISYLQQNLSIPLGIQLFTGRQQHHFETSLTLIPLIEDVGRVFSPGNPSDKKLYVIPGAGYRYQRPQGGLFLKVTVGPYIYLDPPSDNFWKMKALVYGGGSIGAGFSF